MKATLRKSKTSEGKWLRWISGGALALALAGQLVPATANAMIDIGEEVIVIEDEAPWTPPNWGGHTGGGAPNGTPSGDSGGGGAGGGGSIPSGGGSKPKPSSAAKRLANAKQDCGVIEGVWSTAVFKDIDTNVAFAGYSCRYKHLDGQYTWLYYDSEGYLNKRCTGDLEVQTCEAP
jgi:hypothetical protein